MATCSSLVQFSFEVFGCVQGVYMRQYTINAARIFGVTGYIWNTENVNHPSPPQFKRVTASVKGEAVGTAAEVAQFQLWIKGLWLALDASPSSLPATHRGPPPRPAFTPLYPRQARIDAAEFSATEPVVVSPFAAFEKKRVVLSSGTEWAHRPA